MKIKVNEVAPIVSQRYPYTHRVEITANTDRITNQVSEWLDSTGINYVSPSWGVFYLGPQDTSMLLLRWL